MAKTTTKRPRNRAAQDATLIQNRKTRRDIAALTVRVRALEKHVARVERLIVTDAEVRIEQLSNLMILARRIDALERRGKTL